MQATQPLPAKTDEIEIERSITPRVILLSLLLAAFFGYIEPIIDLKLSNTFLGATHFPPGAVGVLLLLVLVINPLLKFVGRRFALGRNELLTIYITCLFSCLVPGHGAENFFLTSILAPFYFATPENKWLDYLLPNLPQWFSPAMYDGYGAAGQEAVAEWYLGNGGRVPVQVWLLPLVAWSSLILASYGMFACLAVLLRAQWSDHEALAFPLLKFPLEMTRCDETSAVPALFRERTFLFGAAAAAFVQMLNGLNFYFPDMPVVPLTIDSTALFTEAPWNQIGSAPIMLWPLVIGVTFLLSAEIAFSLWAFYWITKGQYVLAWALGYPPATLPKIPGFGVPVMMGYTRIGAFFAYVFFLGWIGREHWRLVLRRAFGRQQSTPGEAREALSYPLAFWGFMLAFAFLLAWSVAAGVRLDIALALWVSYLVIALVLTRLVAEGGVLFVQHQWMPLASLSPLLGASALPSSSLVPGSFLQTAMVHDLRGFLLPSFVQSFKLAHDRKIPLRPLLGLIGAVTVISFVIGIWMRVRLGYETGGLQLNAWSAVAGPQWPPRVVSAIENSPSGSGWWDAALNGIWLTLGGSVTWLLMVLRARLPGFPLHPLGYLLSLTYALDVLWTSIFVGWLCKVLVMRFGGHETDRRVTPFFMGLVIGEITMMIFWLLIDGWQGRTMHQLMPG